MQPAIVTRKTARVARENITRRWNNDTIKKHARKAKYYIDDVIRVSRVKCTFEKGYEAKWSEEIFRIQAYILEW